MTESVGREEDQLDPTVSLAVVLTLPISRVDAVRRALADVDGARVVVSKVGAPKTLWIQTGGRDG